MSFGSGGEPGRHSTGSFDFGLGPDRATAATTDARRARRRRAAVDRHILIQTLVISGLAFAVLGGAGALAWSLVQSAEGEVRADSAAMCAELATTPGVLSQPGFGWPTETAGLPDTIVAMRAYQERWTGLAQIAPPTIRPDFQAVAAAAETLASSAEANATLDRPGNLAAMESVVAQTAIVSWTEKYCT